MKKQLHLIILGLLCIWTLSIFPAPLLVHLGYNESASFLYNLHSYDHQWIYRSECIFKDNVGNLRIEDCIPHGKEEESYIKTLFTKNGLEYEGIYNYTHEQIGKNKAEMVIRDDMVGYKFATDVRDYAIYIGIIIGMLAFIKTKGYEEEKIPNIALLILLVIPLALDGATQLLAGLMNNPSVYWLYSITGMAESTNLIRWITGVLAGVGVGWFVVPVVNSYLNK